MGQSTKASKRLTDLLACGVNKLFVGSDLLTEAGSKVCVELSRSTFIYVRSPRRWHLSTGTDHGSKLSEQSCIQPWIALTYEPLPLTQYSIKQLKSSAVIAELGSAYPDVDERVSDNNRTRFPIMRSSEWCRFAIHALSRWKNSFRGRICVSLYFFFWHHLIDVGNSSVQWGIVGIINIEKGRPIILGDVMWARWLRYDPTFPNADEIFVVSKFFAPVPVARY